MSFSFSFSKTAPKRKLVVSSALGLDHDKKSKTEDEIEYIQQIGRNGETKQTEGKESNNELIIPLITQNRWYFPKDSDKLTNGTDKYKESHFNGTSGNGTSGRLQDNDLEEQAIREILNEAREKGDKDAVFNIPLLVQNRIPEGFETDDNLDVSLRPSESTLDDYDRIPVEQFGLAMLRGMGWKKDEGIGLRNKASIGMVEPNVRPSRLGLGATRPKAEEDEKQKNNNHNNRPKSPPPMGLRLNQKSKK